MPLLTIKLLINPEVIIPFGGDLHNNLEKTMFKPFEKNEERDTAAVATLYKLSNFVGSRRLTSIYGSNSSRFGRSPTLFTNLKKDFFYQLLQAVPTAKRRQFREDFDVPIIEMPFETASKYVSDAIRECAETMESDLQVSVLESDKKFVVSRHSDALEAAHREFSFAKGMRLCSLLSTMSAPRGPVQASTFYVGVFCNELGKWLTCLDTLQNPTGLKEYEGILKSLFERPRFFEATGYPHDILCHDRFGLSRPDHKYVGIAISNEYPSSRLLHSDTAVPDGYQVFNIT